MNLNKFCLDSCNFLAVLRVRDVKFGPLFHLVSIGDGRQLEVFTLTGILFLRVLKRDILQSKLLMSQSGDSVSARANNVITYCCYGVVVWCITLTDVISFISLFQFSSNVILIIERP